MSRPSFRALAAANAADAALGDKIHRATLRTVEKRAHLVDELPDWEALRARVREIRLEALERQEELLERFAKAVGARGGHVAVARTAQDARAVVTRLVAEAGGRAIKSKSMTAEEVGLNAALEAAGAEVTETDLGEWIVQQARQPPSHITAPAIHLSVEDVARILHERSGVDVPAWVARGETAEPAVREALARDLSLAARRILRRRFLEADVGVTGANFLVAESGTVVLVENEANIRLTTCLPGRHVVLAGIDKIVPRDEDLGALLRLLPVSATGQRQSGYVSLLADRHTDLHVVLVDNGRSALRRDPEMRDVLTCIRCGACLNACPVYRCIGGHAYGGAYPGPIGALLLPLLGGLERFADLPFASSLCGACSEACPAAIPLHERLLRLRARLVERGRARDLGWTLRRATSAMRSAARMESGARLYRAGRFLLPLLPVARRWARERDLPPAPRETFRAWWARERGGTGRPARPAAAAPRRAEPDRPPPAKPAAPPEDVAARFARRLAELGPAGETEYHRFARAGELRAFLRERLVGTDPAALIVDGERPERRDYAVGITGAAALVADTGGVVVDPASREAALASLLVDTHVVVADPSRFVEGVAELHRLRAEKRARGEWGGLQVVATGPSRTADIEKTLVIPAHGPRRMIVLLCDEPVDPATLRPAR